VRRIAFFTLVKKSSQLPLINARLNTSILTFIDSVEVLQLSYDERVEFIVFEKPSKMPFAALTAPKTTVADLIRLPNPSSIFCALVFISPEN
jgi:hypothetical protein